MGLNDYTHQVPRLKVHVHALRAAASLPLPPTPLFPRAAQRSAHGTCTHHRNTGTRLYCLQGRVGGSRTTRTAFVRQSATLGVLVESTQRKKLAGFACQLLLWYGTAVGIYRYSSVRPLSDRILRFRICIWPVISFGLCNVQI